MRVCGQKSITNRIEKTTMKLEILLRQITLPIHLDLDPETDRPRLGSTGCALHRDSEVIADGIQTPEMAEYLRHAANVLPELVAAVKNLHENWHRNLTGPMDRLNAALARAENVRTERKDQIHHPQ